MFSPHHTVQLPTHTHIHTQPWFNIQRFCPSITC
jgi:hypothetical protein